MSAYEWVSVVIAFAGFLAVVAGLLFVLRQVRMMAEQTRRLSHTLETSAETTLDGLFLAIARIYLDFPQLRPIFNEQDAQGPLPQLDEFMTYRADTLAEVLLDAMERAIMYVDRGLPVPFESLDAWILDSFRHSAFLRAWLTAHAAWYGPRLNAMHATVTAELVKVPSK